MTSGSRINGNKRLLRRQLREKLTDAWQNVLCTHQATYRWIQRILSVPPEESKLEKLSADQCITLLDAWPLRGPGTPDWAAWKAAGCPGFGGATVVRKP